jgi:hypothetical protein
MVWEAIFVGMVEQSDTRQLSEHGDGYRFAPPILRAISIQQLTRRVHSMHHGALND